MITYAGKPIETLDTAELSRFRDYVTASRERMACMADGEAGVKDADLTLREINKQLRRRKNG